MSDTLPEVLTILAIVANGLVAGVFFAFSTFVMNGLARAPAPAGIAAMQGINLAAPTPLFMLALFGAALLGAALGVVAIIEWGTAAATYALIGAIASLVPMVLTGTYHVPRNNALAALDPVGAGAADHWSWYLREWTTWNHARTLGALVAAVMFTVSLQV